MNEFSKYWFHYHKIVMNSDSFSTDPFSFLIRMMDIVAGAITGDEMKQFQTESRCESKYDRESDFVVITKLLADAVKKTG